MRLQAAALALALHASAAHAGSPSCSGTLSGAVKGAFSCTVEAAVNAAGNVRLVIAAEAPPAGVKTLVPAELEIPGPPAAGTHTLKTLVGARASVSTAAGASWSAAKAKRNRGEVSLALESLERERSAGDALTVSGSFHARLVGAGRGKKGEIVLDVTF